MKKLLSILALVLTVALCASFAVSAADVDKLDELGSVSKDVVLDYKPNAPDTDTIVYSVDVTWNDVKFSYDAGNTKWNPDDHEYNAPGDDASWTDDEGKVTVANHSNAVVAVTVSFESANNGTATINVDNGTFELESAVGKAVGAADSDVAILTANGEPKSDAKIGTVTVTIAAN